MDETTTQKQEQMAMQTERELQDLEEREQDIRQLEVTLFLLIISEQQAKHIYQAQYVQPSCIYTLRANVPCVIEFLWLRS